MLLIALLCALPSAPALPGYTPPSRPAPEATQTDSTTWVTAFEHGVLRDDTLRGVWDLAGYGFVLELDERSLRMWSTCSAGSWDVTESEFFTVDELLVDAGASGDRRRITFDPEASPYAIERRRTLPESCSDESAWTPTRTFDAFAAVFSDYYPFFEVHGIDWPERVRAARATVHDGMSDLELFHAMRGTLEELGDGHVGLSAEIDGDEYEVSTDTSLIERRLGEQLAPGLDDEQRESAVDRAANAHYRTALQAVRAELLQGRGQMNRDLFLWGRIQDDLGYIRFDGMGFGGDLSLEEQAREVHAAFDEMLAGLDGVAAVVLDCSFNGGGYDSFSHAIAEHFIDGVRRPYSKAPASRPDLAHTITLRPWSGRRFTGPVFLISSDLTASAAEIFQLTLKDEEHVTLVGTRGARIFSDVIPKTLPNGWELEISIEAYRDAQGVCFEGVGVPMDIEVPLFEGEDLPSSHIRAMERILDHVWASL